MEHEERYYLMMMGALDDELPDADREELTAHLDGCADCRREWQALLAIDTLFRQTPLLMPAVNFAERTLALLPSSRLRVRALSAVYLILLASGIVPLLLALFLVARYAPILQQPALVERVVKHQARAQFQRTVLVLDPHDHLAAVPWLAGGE